METVVWSYTVAADRVALGRGCLSAGGACAVDDVRAGARALCLANQGEGAISRVVTSQRISHNGPEDQSRLI